MWMCIAEVLKVRGQRSRSCVYKCVSVIMVEAYVLMIRHRGSLIYLSISVTLTCDLDLKNLKMYLGTKNELSGSRLSKVRQIDR